MNADVLTIPDFLSPDVCKAVREAVRSATGTAATVVRAGVHRLDDNVRRTTVVTLPTEQSRVIHTPLLSIIEVLQAHFAVPVSGCEEIQFLVYKPGEYFRPHRDCSDDPRQPAYARGRRLAAIIFLNDQQSRPDAYGGGDLLFYCADMNAASPTCCERVVARTGMLVAFLASTIHEVTQVRWGERYTAVSFVH
jgi:predicted 2-oxoglutarate/Fe(II)-dependent dioxygenase YbiX